MEINTIVQSFLAIGIVGAALSLVIQWLQSRWGVEGSATKALCILGSVVLGTIIYFVSQLPIWATILGVLSAASTVYAMVFSGVRKSNGV